MGMKELADDLEARRRRALAMGGAEAVAKQHAEGKLTVRERVDRLFDPGSFHEIGLLASHANISPAMQGREMVVPCDDPADRQDETHLSIVPDSARRAYDMEFRKLINPYIAAGGALIDDVIDPRETRPVLVRALEMASTKKVERPWKKHGVMPV